MPVSGVWDNGMATAGAFARSFAHRGTAIYALGEYEGQWVGA